VKEMSFKSGVKGGGRDRWWERRWWLWWGDMRRMRWTRWRVNLCHHNPSRSPADRRMDSGHAMARPRFAL